MLCPGRGFTRLQVNKYLRFERTFRVQCKDCTRTLAYHPILVNARFNRNPASIDLEFAVGAAVVDKLSFFILVPDSRDLASFRCAPHSGW
jgi:hypothetical protein